MKRLSGGREGHFPNFLVGSASGDMRRSEVTIQGPAGPATLWSGPVFCLTGVSMIV